MLNNYRHILLALDFSPESNKIAEKAQDIAQLCGAKLSVIHVLDNIAMPDVAYGTVFDITCDDADDVSAALVKEKKHLQQLAENLQIPDSDVHMIWGVPKQEIVRYARQQHVDLIVMGSHGRHGMALLLGSTANSVLHHALCDVIAVRVKDE